MIEIRKMPARNKGFTLIAVVLLILAIGIIAFIAGAIGVKLQEIARERNTVKRMAVIKDALKKYYRGHQDLPVPSNVLQVGGQNRGVPVTALDLEQKYSLDAWGQHFYYYECQTTILGQSRTKINALVVDGTQLQAGILISNGPDQNFDTTPTGTCPNEVTYNSTNDDILVAINLQSEAIEITNEELRVLAKKACTYYCANSAWPTNISPDITGAFSLGNNYLIDPWLISYVLDTTSSPPNVYSLGPDGEPSADDIHVKANGLLPCCP